MKISDLNINNKTNLSSPFNPKLLFGVRCEGIKPLEKDTISFCGAGKFNSDNMIYAPSEGICRKVVQNAEPARYYLNLLLDQYIGKLKQPAYEAQNPDKYPVAEYKTAIKSASSIREKIVSKYPDIIKNADKVIAPDSIDGVKQNVKDIVRARIVLQEGKPSQTKKVLDAIQEAVNDKKIKITSVENYLPDKNNLLLNTELDDYIYAKDPHLANFAKAANAEYIKDNKKSGYMGIHLNIDLSDNLYSGKFADFNGYCAEIQILGSDVEQLKDIEDLCYKLKANKKSSNKQYSTFNNYFLKHYNKKYENAFESYTYDSYITQRVKPLSKKRSSQLPSLEKLGYDNKLPSTLDFNKLKSVKTICDEEIKVSAEKDAKETPVKTNKLVKECINQLTAKYKK